MLGASIASLISKLGSLPKLSTVGMLIPNSNEKESTVLLKKNTQTHNARFFQRGRGQLGDSATEATDSTFSGKTLFVNAVRLALLFWLL